VERYLGLPAKRKILSKFAFAALKAASC
jgi:hypothetical protein